MNHSHLADTVSSLAETISPPSVAVAFGHVNCTQASATEEELQLASTWNPSRRCEFLLGRSLARAAFRKGRITDAPASILRDEDGLPQFGSQVICSISHSCGLVGAIAGQVGKLSLLGLDLERVDRLSDSAAKRVVHPEEADFAESLSEGASMLFSLKEAFYKAQFTRDRTRANFSDLALSIDIEQGRASVIYLADRFSQDLMAMKLRFGIVERYVVSVAWLSR